MILEKNGRRGLDAMDSQYGSQVLSGYFERPTRKLVATYWVQSYSNSLKHPNFCDYFMDS